MAVVTEQLRGEVVPTVWSVLQRRS